MAPPETDLPSTASPRRERATYEDLQNVPDDKVAELIGGEIQASPRPARLHLQATAALQEEFGFVYRDADRKRRKWFFLAEPELHFDDSETVLVPDLAGWRIERAPQASDVPFVASVPDWVCEALSPSTVHHDRFRKMPIYARLGVKDLWFLSPREHTVETFTLGADGRWIVGPTATGDARVRLPPFEDAEIVLGPMWHL